jgi:hypothetical protein
MGTFRGSGRDIAPGVEVEAFHVGGNRTGALVRRMEPGVLLTTLAFRLPEGDLVHLRQETRFGASVLGWTSYRYVDAGSGVDIHGTGGIPGGARPPAVPSYAAHLLLVPALRAGRLDFGQFIEDGDGTVLASAFVRQGRETIDTPEGRREGLKVVLEVEGKARNTFWCSGESVLKSDWNGGTSYATRDLPSVLGGLDADVRSIILGALAPPAGR